MRSSPSRLQASESSSSKKNKTQSQREYRSKEMDGFTELRDALLLVDPFDTPLGRDATRHQLLITAAKKLRNLADENQKLISRLSAVPGLHELEPMVSCGMAAQNTDVAYVAWSTREGSMERSRSVSAELAPPLYENVTPGWAHNPLAPPFYGHGHRPHDVALGSSHQGPPVTNSLWGFH